MTTVSSFLTELAAVAPFAKAASWDAVGLQIGDPEAEAGTVAVCHEVTETAVAATAGVDLLIAYHPLLFRAATTFVAGASPSGRAFRLAASGTALAVVHTAFDVAPGGASDSLAAALGLRDVTGFGPLWPAGTVKIATFVPGDAADRVEAAMAAAGAGVIGAYRGCSFRTDGIGSFMPGDTANPVIGSVGILNRVEEQRVEMIAPAGRRDAVVAALVAAHPYEEPAYDVFDVSSNAAMGGRVGTVEATTTKSLAAVAGSVLGAPPRWSGPADRVVRRVAVVPGSGATFIPEAAAVADVLVTGDVRHHEARAALDAGLAVIDAGHVPSERPGIDALYAAVARMAPGATRIEDDPHPWEGT